MHKHQFALNETIHNTESLVHIIPCPHEQTTSYLKGTKFGPDAILIASKELEVFDIETKQKVFEKTKGVYTHFPIETIGKKSSDIFQALYKKTKECLQNQKFPIIIGGEHSLSIGSFRACHEQFDNVSVLHFDAHSDLRNEYEGSKNNHACIMKRIREHNKNTISVGIRSMPKEDFELMEKEKINIFFNDAESKAVSSKKLCNLLTDNVYITIDLDCLDPSIMPAVGTPEPGGLMWNELLHYLKDVFKNKNVVGCDIVELKPQKGLEYADFTAAKLLFKIINYKFE